MSVISETTWKLESAKREFRASVDAMRNKFEILCLTMDAALDELESERAGIADTETPRADG